jgi:hypothetical protein
MCLFAGGGVDDADVQVVHEDRTRVRAWFSGTRGSVPDVAGESSRMSRTGPGDAGHRRPPAWIAITDWSGRAL